MPVVLYHEVWLLLLFRPALLLRPRSCLAQPLLAPREWLLLGFRYQQFERRALQMRLEPKRVGSAQLFRARLRLRPVRTKGRTRPSRSQRQGR